MNLGERLQKLYDYFTEHKLANNKQDFCNKLSLDYSNFAKYLNNTTRFSINAENIKNFKLYNIRIEWLFIGEGSMFLSTENESAIPMQLHKIPLYSHKASAGQGKDWSEADYIEQYIEPMELIANSSNRKLAAFRVAGTSMIGANIADGDVVIFDVLQSQVVEDDIFVFSFNGEIYCKYLSFDEFANIVRVYSIINPDLKSNVPIRELTGEALTDGSFHIIGRVLAWLHENTFIRKRLR